MAQVFFSDTLSRNATAPAPATLAMGGTTYPCPAADKALATIGAVLWSVQIIPQIVKSYRTKNTDGLSPWLMFIWAIACTFQGAYLVSMRSSVPLQIQPQLFGFFGCVSWAQCLYYGSKVPLRRVLLYLGVLYAVLGGFEVGSVFALWAGERHGVTWPKQMYGWITSALLVAGLMPEYWEIYKHRAVVGISVLFMVVDIAGGIFSGVSLFFRDELDYTALAQYMLVVFFDGIVVLLVPILNPAAKRRAARKAALRQEENALGAAAEAGHGEQQVAIDEHTHTLVGSGAHAHHHTHLHRGEADDDLARASVTYSSNLTAVGADDKSVKDSPSVSGASDDTDSALKR